MAVRLWLVVRLCLLSEHSKAGLSIRFFLYLASNKIQIMLLDIALQVSTADCIDCAGHWIDRNLSEAITCTATIVVGIVVRFIEKRKLKKELKQKS